ncbi:MAG: hypothetical protein ABIY55_20825 [Kofleriaceae bacterium]
MRTVGFLVAAGLSLVSLTAVREAHADAGKAWAAAKAALPADAKLVIGVDFAAIQKTQAFATYYPKLRDKPEVSKVLDSMKASCKLDPLTTVQGVVVAMSDDQSEGAVYLAITGADRARLSSCLQTAGQEANKGAKVTITQDGAITTLTENADTSFFGWIGKDVVVVATKAKDKASLVKWMGGKGALGKTDLGKTLAKVNTGAALWGAGEHSKELQPGITAKGGYGSVTFSNGNLAADVHGVMASADQATTMATTANKQLADAKASGALPAPILGLLKSVTVTPAKDEVVVKANVVEKDFMTVLAMAMGGPGGP